MTQPSLPDLLARFLHQRAAEPDVAAPASEVEPYQPANLAADPRRALADGMAAAGWLWPAGAAAYRPNRLEMPPDWGALVLRLEPVPAVPLCLASFPQLVCDPAALAATTQWQPAVAPTPLPELASWGRHQLRRGQPQAALFTAAVLRLAGEVATAAELLEAAASALPADAAGLLANERAALAWQRGDRAEAVRLWESHPDSAAPVVQFNLALADLAEGRRAAAAARFARAAAGLAETSAWHHLAQLYRTVAAGA
jgi:hypothetical protein